MLIELTPDKVKVSDTSPDDSDPLKLLEVNCMSNTIVINYKKNLTKKLKQLFLVSMLKHIHIRMIKLHCSRKLQER